MSTKMPFPTTVKEQPKKQWQLQQQYASFLMVLFFSLCPSCALFRQLGKGGLLLFLFFLLIYLNYVTTVKIAQNRPNGQACQLLHRKSSFTKLVQLCNDFSRS